MRVGLAVFNHTASGMEVGTVDAALGLEAQGIETVLFAEHHATLPDRAAPIADRVVRLRSVPAPLRRPRVADALFLPAKMALARRLAEAVETHPIDVMHVFSPGCAAYLPAGLPVAVQAWFHPPTLRARFRTYLPFAPKFPPLYLANVLREIQSHRSDVLGYRRAQVVLCNTPDAAAAMNAAGFPARSIPPPIEMPSAPNRPVRHGAIELAFCGHPVGRPRKGLRYLLEALTHMREQPVRLTLFGGGHEELREELTRVERTGHSVRPMGRVPRERYLEMLEQEIDILAFPSLYEEWGYALFEGLSRGVAAVAFETHPYAEILDADTGAVAPLRDPTSLARILDRMVTGDRPTPDQVWQSTHARFGSQAVAARLVDLYSGLAGEPARDNATERLGAR